MEETKAGQYTYSVTFHKDCGLKSKLVFSFVIVTVHHLGVMNKYITAR